MSKFSELDRRDQTKKINLLLLAKGFNKLICLKKKEKQSKEGKQISVNKFNNYCLIISEVNSTENIKYLEGGGNNQNLNFYSHMLGESNTDQLD